MSAQSTGQQHATTTSTANATGGEGQPATAAAPLSLSPPTHDPSRPPYRRSWLRNPFTWRRGGSSSSPMNPPPASVLEPLDDSRSPDLQGQSPPSSPQDRLRVTVLVAMPDPRRPHADGAGHSKGKERSLDLDYDEDDLPEMALGLTELQYMDAVTTTTPKLS